MTAHVLSNFKTSWGKEIRCEACQAYYRFFEMSFRSSIIQEYVDSICYMALKLL